MIDAKRLEPADACHAAGRRNLCAQMLEELDSESSDAARSAIDEDDIAGLCLGDIEYRAARAGGRNRYRRRFVQSDVVGYGDRPDSRRAEELRIGSLAAYSETDTGKRGHAIADLKILNVRPNLGDGSSAVHPQCHRERITGNARQQPGTYLPVGGIDTRIVRLNQNLVSSGFGAF